MGKAPIIKENIVWTTGNDGQSNYCVGIFNKNVSKSFIIKEVNDAPIEVDSLTTRTVLFKQKKDFEPNPINKGYSESYIQIFVSQNLDADDLNAIKFKLNTNAKGISTNSIKSDQKNMNSYIFKVANESENIKG